MKQIKEILKNAKHAVFFGGAGVSTDSGIPDFRGAGGLYHGEEELNEYLLSRPCLMRQPERFFSFYKNHMLYPDAKPNATHLALAELERRGEIKAVITQNIDGLHQMAGSQNVIELHGTVHKNYCSQCGTHYDLSFVMDGTGIPKCPKCGGVVRPDVVLYGESLPGNAFFQAEEEIAHADVLIVGGTSLTVNPAASLVGSFQGAHLIIINYTPTPYDGYAELVVRESLSEMFSKLV